MYKAREEISKNTSFESEFVSLQLVDGICIGIYKAGYKLTLDIAKQVVEDRIRFFDGKSFPSYADARHLVEVDADARKYLAGPRASFLVTAGAVHVTSPFSCWLGNVFLLLDAPKIPVKLFTSKELAVEWLSKFKPKI